MMRICFCCKSVACDDCHNENGICSKNIHICKFCKEAKCDVPKEWIPGNLVQCKGYQLYWQKMKEWWDARKTG